MLTCPPFGLLIREPHCPPKRSQEARCSGCLRLLPCRPLASSSQVSGGLTQIICTCVRSARDRGFRGLLKSTRILPSKQISAKPQHENSGQEGWKMEISPRVSQASLAMNPLEAPQSSVKVPLQTGVVLGLILDGVSPRHPGMPDHTRLTVKAAQAVPVPGHPARRQQAQAHRRYPSLRERH